MNHLLFIDHDTEAAWVKQHLPDLAEAKLVAVTSEAQVALEECGLPYTPASAYTDLHRLAAADDQLNRDCLDLLTRIEHFLGSRSAGVKWEGPGLLTGHAYYAQYSVSAIVKRALIFRDAIQAHTPKRVTAFQGPPIPWFAVDGYLRDPWIDWLQSYSKEAPFILDLVTPGNTRIGRGRALIRKAINSCQHLYYGVKKRAFKTRPPAPRQHSSSFDDLDTLKLLFISSVDYDWGPVIRRLSHERGVSCYSISSHRMIPSQNWGTTHASSLHKVGVQQPIETDIFESIVNEREANELDALLTEWIIHEKPRLDVLGIDAFPYLSTQLRQMIRKTPALLRYIDSLAEAALTRIQPQAVCFFALCSLATQRFAHICRERGIPVVCFQHGFGYAVNIQPKDEMTDPAHADYFLTYGAKIQPREHPVVPTRAQFVPVGSTRIDARRMSQRPHQKRSSKILNVIWIAEYFNPNTLNASAIEDTLRFDLYRDCFKLISANPRIHVTYRPYHHAADSFVTWLDKQRFSNVKINAYQPLNDLLEEHDVAVVATTSPTVWAEVVGLRTPMILFCDPQQTLLMPYFIRDLDKACLWCRSPNALKECVSRLVSMPQDVLQELLAKDPDAFVRDYVIHEGNCVDQAISFLKSLRKGILARPNLQSGKQGEALAL